MLHEQVIPDDGRTGPPRKLTAIGTAGEVGQLFTVYEKNWKCPDCNQENYASRTRCFRCRTHKPEGERNYVVDPALDALQGGKDIAWQEVIDPTSYQVYYYNKSTGQTQWERPLEMGPSPHATGWFGRGKAGSVAAQMYAERNAKYLKRQARKQKEFIDPKNYHLEGANEYNIWYGRYLGDHWDQSAGRDPAPDRCVLENDAGATKADGTVSSKKDKKFFCLHFSRGVCAKGKDCAYYHRIPTPDDDARCDELFDCFGRQRHNKHRDDMSGVGSFMKPCRTLFVGGLMKQKYDSPQLLEEALWKHFGEWGEIENINVIHRLSIAFVRFRLRTSAEFCREAMSNQALDHSEIISLRWAHDDPNPVAQDSIARADKDALYALLTAKGISLKDAGYEYPAEYNLPDPKRMKLENGVDPLANNPELAYPNTDNQYPASAENASSTTSSSYPQLTPEQFQQYSQYMMYQYQCMQGMASILQQQSVIASSSEGDKSENSTKTGANNAQEDDQPAPVTPAAVVVEQSAETSSDDQNTNTTTPAVPPVAKPASTSTSLWQEFVDPDTGATYFYNAASGESSWGAPPDDT